jgi:uncharacterized membrane protein
MSKWVKTIVILLVLGSTIFNTIVLLPQSIRLDESQSIWVSTKSIDGILKVNAQDVQVPLYSIILHYWIQIFGTDITVARIPSLMFFALTLPVLFILISVVSDEPTAILGMTLFALSPFILWYSQEARTYSLITLLACLNHLYFLRFFNSRGDKAKFGYFATALLGIYSHYFFGFLLVSQGLYVMAYFIKRLWQKKAVRKAHWSFFIKYILILFMFITCFIPWILFVIRLGSAENTQPLIPKPTAFNLIQVYINFLLGFQSQAIQSLAVSLWPLFLMILFFLFTRKLSIRLAKIDYFVLTTFFPVILVYLLSLYKPIFLSRYLIIVTPSLFVLLAWILRNFEAKLISGISISMLLLMLFSLNYQDKSELNPVKEDYRDVASTISNLVTPQDIVVLSAPFTTYPVEYYYRGKARIDTIPSWNRYVKGSIPKFTTVSLAQQIGGYSTIYNRMFLVLSYDQGYQNEIIDYMDHHYQLMAKHRYPSNINVRVYQLRYDTTGATTIKLGSPTEVSR